MSFINNNTLFGAGSSALGAQGEGSNPFSWGETQTGAGVQPSLDSIAPTPWGAPPPPWGNAADTPGQTNGGWNFNSAMSGFMNAIGSMFGQVGSMFGLSSASAAGLQCGTQAGGGQGYFSSANASSVGDPHDAFKGTSGSGSPVNETWDNMQSHGDLLSSNSFAGGYRVSTTATTPNANGISYNGSASITTSGGATTVSMNANGSYAVTSNGQSVALQAGQSVNLGNGESVTLNTDGSLCVTDTNSQGGSISTTLKSDGNGGVDVTSNASDVNLGGYLVRRSDDSQAAPPNASSYSENPWSQSPFNSLGMASTATSALGLGSLSSALDGSDLDQIANLDIG